MTRKSDRMNVQFQFYTCPICGKEGSIGFRTDADEDQEFTMQCEHRIPIIVEGRINREARKVREQQEKEATHDGTHADAA